MPSGFNGIIIMANCILVIISAAVTLRHFTCVITGAVSGRAGGIQGISAWVFTSLTDSVLFSFLSLSFLCLIPRIFPVNNLIISGLIIVGIMYLIRVIRLFIIFLNRNISIFYLILYLCALEILPVLISVKYFTGLV